MRDGGNCDYRRGNQVDEAVAFLRANRGRVGLITITVGGNDVAPCATSGAVDQTCVTTAISTITANLTRTMAELRAAAPKATIVGATLYDPFLAAFLTGPEGQEFARQSIPVTQAVNRVITDAYRAGDGRIADVESAFSTTDLTTEADGLPLAVARICQWTTNCQTPPDIHPNTEGYTVIASTFRGQI